MLIKWFKIYIFSLQVKLVGRDSSPSPAPPSQQVQAPPSAEKGGTGDADDFDDDDPNVKQRTKSITEQLTHVMYICCLDHYYFFFPINIMC
jgi:hypothetical protein